MRGERAANSKEYAILALMSNLKRNQIGVLGAHVCSQALILFVGTFLVANLFMETGNDLSVVATFHAVEWTALFVSFAFFSYIVKQHSRVLVIRVATAVLVASVCLILVFQDSLVDYYIILAAMFGFACGMYWSSMLTFISQTFAGRKMTGYIVWEQIIFAAARILFPFTLGALIEFVDFGVAAALSLGIGVVLVGFTFFMREIKHEVKPQPLSMRGYLRTMKAAGLSRPLWGNLIIQFLHDFYRRVAVAITVLIVVVFIDEDPNYTIGLFASVFAAANIVIIVCYKMIRSKRVKQILYYISGIVPVLAAIPLLFQVSALTIIILQAGFIAVGCIQKSEIDVLRINAMKIMGKCCRSEAEGKVVECLHTESLLFTEFPMWIVRMTICGVIALAWFFDAFLVFQIFVVFLVALMPIAGLLTKRWYKKYGYPGHTLH